jgi:hypothetical protein
VLVESEASQVDGFTLADVRTFVVKAAYNPAQKSTAWANAHGCSTAFGLNVTDHLPEG